MWRAGTDSLPSKMNLLKRKVLCNDLCPDCKLESESSFHALWTCRVVAPVWKSKFEWLRKLAVRCNSFLDVIKLCQDHNGLLDLLAMTGSLLWSRRNQLRHGEKAIQLHLINATASENLWEFQNAAAPPCPVANVAAPICSPLVPASSEPSKIEMYSSAFYAACIVGSILSCGLTHMAITPLDLVKCNMQVRFF
nr:mitochondrial phosphate carrier protein 3, mitochondrial [Quercus suber]